MGRRISLGVLGKGSIEWREGGCLLRFEVLYVFNLMLLYSTKGVEEEEVARSGSSRQKDDEMRTNFSLQKNEISARFYTD